MTRRILIVDDDAIIRARLQALLTQNGYESFTAEDAFVAKSVLEHQPDLVLMDVAFGSDIGPHAIRVLRDRGIGDTCKMVLFSSKSAGELEKLAEECGADGFICKSPDDESMLNQITSYLDSLVV